MSQDGRSLRNCLSGGIGGKGFFAPVARQPPLTGNTTSAVAAALTLTLSLDRGCRFLDEVNCGGADGMIKWVRVRWWRWVERRACWKATHNWGSGARGMQAPGKLSQRRARSAS